MASSGRKKPPLVADKRYPAAPSKKAAGAKAAQKKSGAKTTGKARKTKAAPRKRTTKKPTTLLGRLRAFVVGLFFGILRFIWRFTIRMAAVSVLLVLGIVLWYAMSLPPVADQLDARARGSVTFLDRDRDVFTWRGEQYGGAITSQTVSRHLKNAIIATEDKRFYSHFGVSPRGVLGAIRINLREGRGPLSGHGGSTITQQTAKLLCLGVPYVPEDWKNEAAYEADCRRGTIVRKAKEALYALAMEVRYSKDEILTIYFNRAYMGARARGVEAAAQRYFAKSASAVNASEAAMMAGLLVAPSRYAPTNNLSRSQDRAATVVRLMQEQGYLSSEDAAIAQAQPATLSPAAKNRIGDAFADWVMSTGPSFLTRDTTEDVIIRTTFDPSIQRAIEEAVAHVFETKVRKGSIAETAVLVMSADGAVRAMVGGRDSGVAGAFNRATQARRQMGSVFKPFVYGAALDLGHTSRSTVDDEPITIDTPGSGPWSPKNYGGEYMGRVTLSTALAHSLNTAAVRVSEYAGRENVRQVAKDFGITGDLAPGPALALGASEASLLEVASAYAGILNGGQAVSPYGVINLHLQGEDAPLMGQQGGLGKRVISEDAARELTHMMYLVIEEGTGRRAKLQGWEAAGKTGTTQAARDAWFVGFTREYVTAVWMGYDDNTPLTGVTGGGLPADIWREAMVRIHKNIPAGPLPMVVRNSQVTIEPRNTPDPVKELENAAENVIRDLIRGLLGRN